MDISAFIQFPRHSSTIEEIPEAVLVLSSGSPAYCTPYSGLALLKQKRLG